MFGHQKFILYDGEIRLGRVSLHKELLPDGHDLTKVKGGGWFEIDTESKRLILSGKSFDFGPYDQEAAATAKLPKRLEGYELIFA